jgi:hypothetical protein
VGACLKPPVPPGGVDLDQFHPAYMLCLEKHATSELWGSPSEPDPWTLYPRLLGVPALN